MVEPINLNKARKARARVQALAEAAENRARFGRSKGEKAADRLELERARRSLDAKKREEP